VLLTQQISATRHTLVASRQQLGANLRLLYKQGDTDPLAVVLGAESLSDAVDQIDALNRVADQSEQIVATTTAAQIRLGRLRSKRLAISDRADNGRASSGSAPVPPPNGPAISG